MIIKLYQQPIVVLICNNKYNIVAIHHKMNGYVKIICADKNTNTELNYINHKFPSPFILHE